MNKSELWNCFEVAASKFNIDHPLPPKQHTIVFFPNGLKSMQIKMGGMNFRERTQKKTKCLQQ
jgi:hypothetical protein